MNTYDFNIFGDATKPYGRAKAQSKQTPGDMLMAALTGQVSHKRAGKILRKELTKEYRIKRISNALDSHSGTAFLVKKHNARGFKYMALRLRSDADSNAGTAAKPRDIYIGKSSKIIKMVKDKLAQRPQETVQHAEHRCPVRPGKKLKNLLMASAMATPHLADTAALAGYHFQRGELVRVRQKSRIRSTHEY